MAVARKKRPSKKKKVKFELTRSAIGGIGVVVFCLFLWMFLFGVWAGQSLLKPADFSGGQLESSGEQTQQGPLVIEAENRKQKR